jgi:hypothetical protein
MKQLLIHYPTERFWILKTKVRNDGIRIYEIEFEGTRDSVRSNELVYVQYDHNNKDTYCAFIKI